VPILLFSPFDGHMHLLIITNRTDTPASKVMLGNYEQVHVGVEWAEQQDRHLYPCLPAWR